MAGDHRIVISSEPSLSPEEVATHAFATSFRGYDPAEVRGWLGRVAKEMRALRDRERELQRLLERAQDDASNLPLDEAALTTALGEETARVLRSAREAATDITLKAEEKAGRLLRETQDQANRVRTETEQFAAQRMDEANQAAAAVLRAAEADADALRAQARADAEAEIESARARGKEMVAEAMAVRERVLADLSRRRRTAHAQLEQLRAGRERLLEAYRLVRRTLDEVTADLTVADAEARAAAEAAGRRVAAEAVAEADELDAELALARAVELPVADLPAPAPVTGEHDAPAPAEPAEPAELDVPPAPDERPGPPARPEGLTVITTTPMVERPSPLAPAASSAAPAEGDDAPANGNGPDAGPRGRRSHTLRLLRRGRGDDEGRPPPPPGFAPVDRPHPDEAVRVVPGEPAPAVETPAAPAAEVVPAEAQGEEADAPAPSTVSELFARIRAAREAADEVTASPAEPAEPVADEVPTETPETPETPEAPETTEPVPVATDDGDETARCRRDELLDPIEAGLVRKVKRALQDEQNEVLDALRTQRRTVAIDALLPPADDHRRRYESVAAFALADAFRAGVTFVVGDADRLRRAGTPHVTGERGKVAGANAVEPVVTEPLRALAAALVDDLRDRVAAAVAELAEPGTDPSAAVEPINAAYREAKTQRAERVTRDAVTAAFSAGAYAAFPDGGALRWVVDSDGEPCPDAHDNALSGPTPKGTAYPTGQAHPPAHAGCRCLLVPAAQ